MAGGTGDGGSWKLQGSGGLLLFFSGQQEITVSSPGKCCHTQYETLGLGKLHPLGVEGRNGALTA